jgi:NADH:ubiquinone oxidoreductase subunit 3 (subunit A)
LPSGWNVYYIAVLAGGLALLIPLALLLISRGLSPDSPNSGDGQDVPGPQIRMVQSDNPVEVGRKSNPRLFQALNASLILILLALLMVPCAVSLSGRSGLISILSLCVIAGLGLLYGVRKQDLEWLKTWGRE